MTALGGEPASTSSYVASPYIHSDAGIALVFDVGLGLGFGLESFGLCPVGASRPDFRFVLLPPIRVSRSSMAEDDNPYTIGGLPNTQGPGPVACLRNKAPLFTRALRYLRVSLA